MQVKMFDVGGINLMLSELEAKSFSKFLTNMSNIPDLKSMIRTDENGLVVYFEPAPNIDWGFIFLVQNLMIMQRLRMVDDLARKEGIIK